MHLVNAQNIRSPASCAIPSRMLNRGKLCAAVRTADAAVVQALAPHRRVHYKQQNYFFDTPDARIGAARRSLRIRIYDDDKAVITIKVSPFFA